MTLTTAGKDWLATHAGVNNCFSPANVSFLDGDGVPFTGGTKDVVIAFIGAHMGLKDDAIIIADTSYNGFKAINGGDLSYPDATFANNSDGHEGAILPQYCVITPANVISATLWIDTNDCVAPCTVNGTVSWTNNGGTISTPMDMQVTVNGGTPTTVAAGLAINPYTTTALYPFSLSNLVAGTYSICASPNSGTTCQTVNVTAPLTDAYFTSIPSGAFIYIDGSPTLAGVTPATITGLSLGQHTYRLTSVGCNDEPTGSFTTVVGSTVPVDVTFDTSARFESTPAGARIWLDGIDKGVNTPGVVTGLTPGEHTYKLTKSGYMDVEGTFITVLCQRVNTPANLSRLQEAGMGGLMMVGLMFGALIFGKKKKKEDENKKIKESIVR